MWSRSRLIKIHATTRPDNVWPVVCTQIVNLVKERELRMVERRTKVRQRSAIEIFLLYRSGGQRVQRNQKKKKKKKKKHGQYCKCPWTQPSFGGQSGRPAFEKLPRGLKHPTRSRKTKTLVEITLPNSCASLPVITSCMCFLQPTMIVLAQMRLKQNAHLLSRSHGIGAWSKDQPR